MEERLRIRLADALASPITDVLGLSGGASYQSFRIDTGNGERWHVRAASTTPAAVELDGIDLATEADLLGRAGAAGVPAPAVRAVLTDPPALVLEWLEGETLGGRIARRPEFAPARRRFAAQCGTNLARLHQVPCDDVDLPEKPVVGFVTETHARYRRLGSPRPMLDAVARRLIDTAPPPVEATLVHGDFRNGNLMVDPQRGIIGVLDWELAHRGDPMSDLGYLLVNSWRFGVPERPVGGCGPAEELFDAYRTESGQDVDRERVRWWQAAGSLWWAVTCLVQASRFDPADRATVPYAAIGPRVSEAEVDCADLLIGATRAQPLTEGTDDRAGEAGGLVTAVGLYRSGPPGTAYEERVVASLDRTIDRERRLGSTARRREANRLVELLEADGVNDLGALRADLADRLWRGTASIADPAVAAHLAATALDRLQIDQPDYRRA